jgi:hypothetical protein
LRLVGFAADLARRNRRGFFAQPWLVHTQPCIPRLPIFMRLRCQESEWYFTSHFRLCESPFCARDIPSIEAARGLSLAREQQASASVNHHHFPRRRNNRGRRRQ